MMRRPATLPIVCALLLTSTAALGDRKSTRLNSSHSQISYAVFCLKKKKNTNAAHICSAIAPTSLLFCDDDPLPTPPSDPFSTYTLLPWRSVTLAHTCRRRSCESEI